MTNKTPIAVVILAAGRGTRMKSKRPKVMHRIAGRPMISWLIETAEELNPEKIIVVTAPDMDDVAEVIAPHARVIQKTQSGTGDAVKPALELLKDFDGKVLVLLGDEPFLDKIALEQMIATGGISVMAMTPESSTGFGRMVVRADGSLEKIVEEKDCSDEERQIDLCNAGNFCIPASHLEKWLSALGNDNAQKEYYLTDIPNIAEKDGFKTQVIEAECDGFWGINSRLELACHEALAQDMLRAQAMDNGVTLIAPATVTFNWDTKIGQDVVIEANVIFAAGVTIEDDVRILGFSYIEESHIESGATIGPFARLRPKTRIGAKAKVGTFVEVNRSTIEAGAKAPHLSYLGDVTIGAKTNIGAGTIFANYDGFFKHKSTVGENVFIGSNTTLISPVKIGDGAMLAAGSNINKDVPDHAMAIGRSRQENHEGWATQYRKFKQAEKNKV